MSTINDLYTLHISPKHATPEQRYNTCMELCELTYEDDELTWYEVSNDLAMMLIYGNGVEKNVPKGIELLKTLAERGDEQSMVTLAELYTYGEVVEKNLDLAAEYIANTENDDSCDDTHNYLYALFNENGWGGMPVDLDAAYMAYSCSAERFANFKSMVRIVAIASLGTVQVDAEEAIDYAKAVIREGTDEEKEMAQKYLDSVNYSATDSDYDSVG